VASPPYAAGVVEVADQFHLLGVTLKDVFNAARSERVRLDYLGELEDWQEAVTDNTATPAPEQVAFSARRVQQIVKAYAERADVKATPHTFRHQAITWLTRHSGLADAELQLLTGHAHRETLTVYQHVALDGDLEQKYQQTMKHVGL
jgi:site-specific recombinase XerD